MRLEFQKNIAISQFTLPIVSILGLLLWIMLPLSHSDSFSSVEYGLWHFIPSVVVAGKVGVYAAIGFSALVVYLLAEMTNTFALLRISSRMLSSTVALLMAGTLCLHTFQPGHIVAVMYLLSLLSIFLTYQMPLPTPTFLAYLFLSLSSLVFPKIIFLTPVFWISQIYLRAFTIRCFVASLLGLLLPYWFFFVGSLCIEGGFELFLNTCKGVIEFSMPAYHSVLLADILIFAFVTLFFIAGVIDFHLNSFLDKTRSRSYFSALIGIGFILMILIIIQPQYFHTLLLIYMINASFVGGHFIALTYNKISHIYCLVMVALFIALIVLQITL